MSRKCRFSGPLLNKIHAKCPNYKAFAEDLDVHYTTVYRWLRGDFKPQFSIASRICDVLDCSFDELEEAFDEELET